MIDTDVDNGIDSALYENDTKQARSSRENVDGEDEQMKGGLDLVLVGLANRLITRKKKRFLYNMYMNKDKIGDYSKDEIRQGRDMLTVFVGFGNHCLF
ncbi:MAG: hypothetical protein HY779_00680 [Rubrobacteridae bacterium]|nr:hypothetical protein [Rubrobacteridae bacterium]